MIFCECFSIKAQQQQFEWVKEFSAEIYSNVVDNENNCYVVGSHGYSKIQFAKYDSLGNEVWKKEIICPNCGTLHGFSISLDLEKNIIISGNFSCPTYFGTDSITTFPDNDHNAFLSKFDNNGDLIWIKNIAHTTAGVYHCVHGTQSKVDNSNNIYFVGQYADTLILADTIIPENNNLKYFYGKFSSEGQLLWIKTIAADLYYRMTIDNLNNLLLIGVGYETIGSDTINKLFLTKIDSSGNIQWTKIIDAIINPISTSISVDSVNNIYLTGKFTRIAHFGNDSLIGNAPLSGSMYKTDIFVTKYDADGNFIWAKKAGGLNNDNSYSITTNQKNIYIYGNFNKTVYFESDSLISQSILYPNYFIASYNFDGQLLWVKQISTKKNIIYSNPFYYNISSYKNNVYLTGFFPDSTYFDNILKPNYGNFIIKLKDNFNDFIHHNIVKDFIQCYPNPVHDKLYIIKHDNDKISGELINIEGKEKNNYKFENLINEIDFNDFTNGVYILQFKSSKKTTNIKIIKN